MRIILSWSGVAGTTGLGETQRDRFRGHSFARNDSPSGWLRKVQGACSGGQYSERRFRYATWLISLFQSAGWGGLLIVRHRGARLLGEDRGAFSPSVQMRTNWSVFRRCRERFADRRTGNANHCRCHCEDWPGPSGSSPDFAGVDSSRQQLTLRDSPMADTICRSCD